MSVNGIGTMGYPAAGYGVRKAQQNAAGKNVTGGAAQSSRVNTTGKDTYNGPFHLRMGGMVSRALSDGGNVTVYEADGYSAENPMVRVVTTSADGQEYEQIIDPRTVDVSKATENEMLALNAYLVREGKLDNSVYSSGVLSGAGLSNADTLSVMNLKQNFFINVKEMMEMQYNAHNLAGYAKYRKLYDVYDLFMRMKPL